MKNLCFDLVLLLVIGLVWSLESTCPQLDTNSKCQCFVGSESITVECKHITNTVSLYNEIQKLKGFPIDDFYLIGVKLPYLPAGLFSGTSIKRIHITASRLDNLYSVTNSTPSPFEGLQNTLEEIHVRFTSTPNKWYWPDMRDFKHMKSFQFDHSHISFIGHVFAEIGDGSLEIISARHSQVNRIHPQGFTELTNLREANFDSNNLPYLVRTMFANPAPRLERLNFKNNKLFTLDDNMFENMPALKYLDFSQNEFTSYKEIVFNPVWNNLEFLGLSENPFHCECNLLLLKARMVSTLVPKENDLEDITCMYKEAYKKTRLIDVQRNNPELCLW